MEQNRLIDTLIKIKENCDSVIEENSHNLCDSMVNNINNIKNKNEQNEHIKNKNSNLIKIYRPIGVNTVGSRLGDLPGGCDIKLPPPLPKYIVSPWLNSSITCDANIAEKFKFLL